MNVFSGVICYELRSLKVALRAQTALLEDKRLDVVEDELTQNKAQKTYFVLLTVKDVSVKALVDSFYKVNIAYLILTNANTKLYTSSMLMQWAHRVAIAVETPDGLRWKECKNRYGLQVNAKYSLEEIKRIYRSDVEQRQASALSA